LASVYLCFQGTYVIADVIFTALISDLSPSCPALISVLSASWPVFSSPKSSISNCNFLFSVIYIYTQILYQAFLNAKTLKHGVH
jgi:hypothetical protein